MRKGHEDKPNPRIIGLFVIGADSAVRDGAGCLGRRILQP